MLKTVFSSAERIIIFAPKAIFGSWNVRLNFGTFLFVVKKRSRCDSLNLVFTGRILVLAGYWAPYCIDNLRNRTAVVILMVRLIAIVTMSVMAIVMGW